MDERGQMGYYPSSHNVTTGLDEMLLSHFYNVIRVWRLWYIDTFAISLFYLVK